MSKQSEDSMSFLEHLEILRWHLIRSSIAILVFMVLAFAFKHLLFDIIIFGPKQPDFVTYRFFCEFTQKLGQEGIFCMDKMPFSLINNKMSGQFSTHIWVSLIAGFILAFPYLLYEVWRFVKPGLYPHERRFSGLLLILAALLFLTGVVFGYYLIVPLSVQFLGGYSVSAEVDNLIDLMSYIMAVSTITLATGLIFELPVVVYFLAQNGLVTPQWMKNYRRHAYVTILLLSAIITPPDIASQILVTIPVVVLYEISIGISRRVERRQEQQMKKAGKT